MNGSILRGKKDTKKLKAIIGILSSVVVLIILVISIFTTFNGIEENKKWIKELNDGLEERTEYVKDQEKRISHYKTEDKKDIYSIIGYDEEDKETIEKLKEDAKKAEENPDSTYWKQFKDKLISYCEEEITTAEENIKHAKSITESQERYTIPNANNDLRDHNILLIFIIVLIISGPLAVAFYFISQLRNKEQDAGLAKKLLVYGNMLFALLCIGITFVIDESVYLLPIGILELISAIYLRSKLLDKRPKVKETIYMATKIIEFLLCLVIAAILLYQYNRGFGRN